MYEPRDFCYNVKKGWRDEEQTYYDTFTGQAVFKRDFGATKEFESLSLGWPVFRDAEIVDNNIKVNE